jgi:hypothetical protein
MEAFKMQWWQEKDYPWWFRLVVWGVAGLDVAFVWFSFLLWAFF